MYETGTVHSWSSRPLGLQLGSRNGITYVYKTDDLSHLVTDNNKTKKIMADARRKSNESFVSLIIVKVQEIDVTLWR